MVGLVGGALGVVVGSNRAFALRLMAQTALCQMQIERNTRPAAGDDGTGAAAAENETTPPIRGRNNTR